MEVPPPDVVLEGTRVFSVDGSPAAPGPRCQVSGAKYQVSRIHPPVAGSPWLRESLLTTAIAPPTTAPPPPRPHHRAPTTAPCTALGGSTSGNHGRPGAVSGHGLACQLELVQDGDEEKNVEGDDKEDHGEDDDEEDHGEDDDQIFNFFMNIDDFSLTFLSPFSHPSLTSLSPPSHLPLTFPSSCSPSSLKPVKVSPHPSEVGRSLLRMRAGPWT